MWPHLLQSDFIFPEHISISKYESYQLKQVEMLLYHANSSPTPPYDLERKVKSAVTSL